MKKTVTKSFLMASALGACILTACTHATSETTTEVLDGAQEAAAGDPIAAASVLITDPDGVPVCNGVLLGDGLVATAAACADGKAEDFRINAGGTALLPVLKLTQADDVALLRVKFDALPQTSRAMTLGPGSARIDGTLRLATFLKNQKLAIAAGKVDQPESLPGFMALRLDAGGKLTEKQLGSGIYAEMDGKPVLVGLYTTKSKRGNIVFIQDVRGRELR